MCRMSIRRLNVKLAASTSTTTDAGTSLSKTLKDVCINVELKIFLFLFCFYLVIPFVCHSSLWTFILQYVIMDTFFSHTFHPCAYVPYNPTPRIDSFTITSTNICLFLTCFCLFWGLTSFASTESIIIFKKCNLHQKGSQLRFNPATFSLRGNSSTNCTTKLPMFKFFCLNFFSLLWSHSFSMESAAQCALCVSTWSLGLCGNDNLAGGNSCCLQLRR